MMRYSCLLSKAGIAMTRGRTQLTGYFQQEPRARRVGDIYQILSAFKLLVIQEATFTRQFLRLFHCSKYTGILLANSNVLAEKRKKKNLSAEHLSFTDTQQDVSQETLLFLYDLSYFDGIVSSHSEIKCEQCRPKFCVICIMATAHVLRKLF